MMDGTNEARSIAAAMEWDGTYGVSWTLTPSTQGDVVDVLLPPVVGFPIFPVRVGLSDQGVPGDIVTGVDQYPAQAMGHEVGLRAMRPGSYIHLLWAQDGAPQFRVFMVTDDGRFQAWPLLDDGGSEAVGDTLPYLPGPSPSEVDELALLVVDTRLSREALEALHEAPDKLERLGARVELKQGVEQPGAFALQRLAEASVDFAENAQSRWLEWSESVPFTPAGSIVERTLATAARQSGAPSPMGVVLPDTIGLLSEANHLASQRVAALQDYASEASRKLWVNEAIDAFVRAEGRQAHRQAWKAQGINQQTNRRAASQAAMAAEQRAIARREAFAAPKAERQAFADSHQATMERLMDEAKELADALFVLYQPLREELYEIADLYDERDAENFVDLRATVACTLSGLSLSIEGQTELLQELGEDGPTGLLKRAMVGHPSYLGYFESRSTIAGAGTVAAAAAKAKLVEVLARIPADEAAFHLSLVTGALVRRRRLGSGSDFADSPYGGAFELMGSVFLGREQVPLKDLAPRLAAQMGVKDAGAYQFSSRMTAIAWNQMVTIFQSEEIQPQVREFSREVDRKIEHLKSRSRYWMRLRVGFGFLSVFVGLANLEQLLTRVPKEDGERVSALLGIASEGMMVVSGATATRGAVLEGRAFIARASGEMMRHEALKWRALGAERGAIAAMSVALILVGFRDGLRASEEVSLLDRSLLVSAAGIGMGGGLVGLTTLLGSTAAERVAKLLGRGIISRAAFGLMTLGAGKVGVLLFVATVIVQSIHSYLALRAERRRVDSWIARSIWGHSDRVYGLAFDVDEEYRTLLQMTQAPVVETSLDLAALGRLAFTPTMVADTLAQRPMRDVVIVLPGWQPEVSDVVVRTFRDGLAYKRVEQELGNDAVTLNDGVGVVELQTRAVRGRIEVRFRPNRFTQPQIWLVPNE